MKLSKEEALRLHREMWSDMQKELGDCPSAFKRELFKEEWCDKHFPNTYISHCCFLCEYAIDCDHCPINWSSLNFFKTNRCYADYRGTLSIYERRIFLTAPISEILALPER